MHDWESEFDALVAEMMAFAKSLKVEIERPRPTEIDERGDLSGPDYGSCFRRAWNSSRREDAFRSTNAKNAAMNQERRQARAFRRLWDRLFGID
ncbi:hypothetical protein [Bradyrhizobium sp. LA2.1]|uniref:hypothetical protein n=1 Tax=Bradyrhizobium sp. LA2.1 TaxID=3156376 RepID=UPI003392C6A9